VVAVVLVLVIQMVPIVLIFCCSKMARSMGENIWKSDPMMWSTTRRVLPRLNQRASIRRMKMTANITERKPVLTFDDWESEAVEQS
jgi:hypothetical protein